MSDIQPDKEPLNRTLDRDDLPILADPPDSDALEGETLEGEAPLPDAAPLSSDLSALPRVPIVILAGGKSSMDMEAATGVSNRALIKFNGKPMLLRVVEALRASELCGDIVVIGKVPRSEYYSRLADKGDFVANTVAGAVANENSPFVLICTCDLPFLTGEAVTDFLAAALAKATQTGASVVYPVVPVGRCYRRFPGLKRTALKLKEGRFTGGNMMLARPQFIMSQKKRIAAAYSARKSPLRLANMLGWDMILRLLMSQMLFPRLLTLPVLEKRVSELIAGPARVFVSAYPEIATDLDKPSDYLAALAIFRLLEAGGALPALPEMVPGKEEKIVPPRKKVRTPAAKQPAKAAAQKGKVVARKRTP